MLISLEEHRWTSDQYPSFFMIFYSLDSPFEFSFILFLSFAKNQCHARKIRKLYDKVLEKEAGFSLGNDSYLLRFHFSSSIKPEGWTGWLKGPFQFQYSLIGGKSKIIPISD